MKANYADLQSRVKAVVIDSVIIVVLMYCTSILLDNIDNVQRSIRMFLAVLYLILYEPILISIFGFTLGHYYSDIHVKKANNLESNLSFPLALLRFTFKFFLGWLSLVTVTSSEKKQAIHDAIANSVVLIDD